MTTAKLAPRLVGLAIAFGGPALLLSPADRLLGPQERLATKVLEQAVMWLFLGIIVAIVRLWEKETVASMWLRPFAWSSFAWGLLLAAVTIYIVMPALTYALWLAGIPGFEAGMAAILVHPVRLRVIGVITAGVVEDGLFLGYGFTQLARHPESGWPEFSRLDWWRCSTSPIGA